MKSLNELMAKSVGLRRRESVVMIKLTIDKKEYEIDAGMTVLQACEQAGIEIPRVCYHERLSLAVTVVWGWGLWNGPQSQ